MITRVEIDGNQYRYDIPNHVSERTFEDFCHFRELDHHFLDQADQAGMLEAMISACQAMVKGPVNKLPVAQKGEHMDDLIKEGFQLELGEPITIHRLYAHLVVLIQTYQPTHLPRSYTFKWNKTTFQVERMDSARTLAGIALSTGEAIEVLEFQRRADDQMKTEPKDFGSIDFNLGLREFAILVRKKDEELPSNKKRRQAFIAKRIEFFKSVPLNYILDLRFFFAASWMNYIATKQINSSGTVPLLLPEGRKAKLTRSVRRLLRRRGKSWDGAPFTTKH